MELIPLVVSGSPPAPPKVKLLFGHQVTEADAKHHGASTQCCSNNAADLQTQLKAETADWNPPGDESVEFAIARLHRLCSSPIGGLLMTASHWDPTSASFGDPVLQVLASPAVSSLGSFSSSDHPGVDLSEAWDLTSPPFEHMPQSDTTCPVLAMSGGFSRGQAAPFAVAQCLQATAPLFIPSGEEAAGTVSIFPKHPLFLPTVSSLPIGMFWKTKDLTTAIMMQSIHALSASSVSPYASFIHALEQALNRRLHDWLAAAAAHPDRFACQVFGYDTSIKAQFPSLVTGVVPDTVLCTSAFAPLMDMRHLCTWRILLDSILSSAACQDIEFLRLFPLRASTCIHSDTYLGVRLRHDLTPNMGIHFKARGGWPTDSADPLLDFSRPEVSSQISQRYNCIAIKVHSDHPAPADDVKLMTAAEASARRHHKLTPRTSLVPAESLASQLLQQSQASSVSTSNSNSNSNPNPNSTSTSTSTSTSNSNSNSNSNSSSCIS
jgi:hypothetical protein